MFSENSHAQLVGCHCRDGTVKLATVEDLNAVLCVGAPACATAADASAGGRGATNDAAAATDAAGTDAAAARRLIISWCCIDVC